MRGAQALGIRTVAVCSDADSEALHTRTADEAVRIGGLTAADSYLDVEKIIAACKQSGADALHPGYGFLSENARFAAAVEEAGIAFVGPPAEAIRLMGDKLEAKRIAAAAGVPVIPGRPEAMESADAAAEAAADIGYPVLLKAQAGGGGRGMRIARDEAECRAGYEQAVREAEAAFADGRVFVEKYLERPRHIEVQVLADGHGSVVHLGERECSIQRRYQKVIEEAPSPFVTPEMRSEMGEAAVSLAKAIGYRSAGTVEFVVDASGSFHLLEMNTRLQVEHPITEWIAGIDLVQWMLRIAAGDALDFTQDNVELNGWSMEARICAEDPERDFLPAAGRLVRWLPPAAGPALRLDAGVEEGDEASVYYDSLVAKLVVYGRDRDQAASRLAAALDNFAVEGPATNVLFLASLARHPRFVAGDLTTAFIAEEYPEGFRPGADCPAALAQLLGAVTVLAQDRAARLMPEEWTQAVLLSDGEEMPLKRKWENGRLSVRFGRRVYRLESGWRPYEPVVRCKVRVPKASGLAGDELFFVVRREGLRVTVSHAGAKREFVYLPPRSARLKGRMAARPAHLGVTALNAPMPGVLTQLQVAEGDEVKTGQEIGVIEAMKMENSLRSPRDGRIRQVAVSPGDNLETNQFILRYE
ncbi:MAG: biotin/lipoyl-binding protein [Gammaproteobacteria bacterium]|nr:biotin/lipoyl-binding protein [Gammaproteobacteria bacterium]MDE0412959.1 biotin/lipoyl-binding protein [Gammaproteobacteria bacterium]